VHGVSSSAKHPLTSSAADVLVLVSEWHLDEVFIQINSKVRDLWRAVDQDGNVADILVQSRRNKKATQKFLRGS